MHLERPIQEYADVSEASLHPTVYNLFYKPTDVLLYIYELTTQAQFKDSSFSIFVMVFKC